MNAKDKLLVYKQSRDCTVLENDTYDRRGSVSCTATVISRVHWRQLFLGQFAEGDYCNAHSFSVQITNCNPDLLSVDPPSLQQFSHPPTGGVQACDPVSFLILPTEELVLPTLQVIPFNRGMCACVQDSTVFPPPQPRCVYAGT